MSAGLCCANNGARTSTSTKPQCLFSLLDEALHKISDRIQHQLVAQSLDERVE